MTSSALASEAHARSERTAMEPAKTRFRICMRPWHYRGGSLADGADPSRTVKADLDACPEGPWSFLPAARRAVKADDERFRRSLRVGRTQLPPSVSIRSRGRVPTRLRTRGGPAVPTARGAGPR